jgi:hypothetical protein
MTKSHFAGKMLVSVSLRRQQLLEPIDLLL